MILWGGTAARSFGSRTSPALRSVTAVSGRPQSQIHEAHVDHVNLASTILRRGRSLRTVDLRCIAEQKLVPPRANSKMKVALFGAIPIILWKDDSPDVPTEVKKSSTT